MADAQPFMVVLEPSGQFQRPLRHQHHAQLHANLRPARRRRRQLSEDSARLVSLPADPGRLAAAGCGPLGSSEKHHITRPHAHAPLVAQGAHLVRVRGRAHPNLSTTIRLLSYRVRTSASTASRRSTRTRACISARIAPMGSDVTWG
eukprot:scaffold61917_cov59-Phaeocystis_antarctica.AAC.1